MSDQSQYDQEILVRWFENHYQCHKCEVSWNDEWSCMCNDRCPKCGHETEPTTSRDLSRPVTDEDFAEATRFLLERHPDRARRVSPQEVREYAEALLEGGEYRLLDDERVVPQEVTMFTRSLFLF